MTDRLKALRRVAAVQDQVRRVADAKLAAAERRLADLAAAAADLGAFVEEGCPVGDLARLAARQRTTLALRTGEAEAERTRSAGYATEAKRRQTLTERRIDELDLDARRAAERRDLQRVLDAHLARPPEPD